MELRTEESPDIQPYTHERKIDKIVIPLGEVLTAVKENYLKVVGVVVSRLQRHNVLHSGDPRSMAMFSVLKSRDMFRQNPPEGLPRSSFGQVEGDFALAMSLFHGLELLQAHGLRSLYNYLNGMVAGDNARKRTELMRNTDFTELLEDLRVNFDLVR